jgi:uncharacterized membrane protein YdjX (TVP38/TMEM64 family)
MDLVLSKMPITFIETNNKILDNLSQMKKNSLYILFLGVLGILPTFISSYLTYILYKNSELLTNTTAWETMIFFCIVTFTMALAITPTTFVAIIAGYFFSWAGLIGILISYVMASILGVFFGRGLQKFGLKYTPKPGSKFEKLLNNFGKNEFLLIAFARLSPVLPFAMTNVALSSINLKWKNYIAGSLVGMLPRTLLFFWAGKNAGDIWKFVSKPSLDGAYRLVPLALVVISSVGLYWIVKQKMDSKGSAEA